MKSYSIDIPDFIFVNDLTIIYKGKEEKEGQIIEPIEEIKTSRDEFYRKLRYFRKRRPETLNDKEIFIHEDCSVSNFRDFIESIKTKSLLLNENNFNIFYELSLKFEYYELQSKIEDFMKSRPDIQSIVNQLSEKKNHKKDEKNHSKSEIDTTKEEIISKHLDICLQNENLMNLPVKTLHRIFSSPKKVLNNHHLLYEFVRKIIEKYESSKKSQDQSKAKEDLQLLIGTLEFDKMTDEEIEGILDKKYLSSVFVQKSSTENQQQLKEIEERIKILEKFNEEKDKELKEMSLKLLHQEEIIKNYELKLKKNSDETQNISNEAPQTKENQQVNNEIKPVQNVNKTLQHTNQIDNVQQKESTENHLNKQEKTKEVPQIQQTKQDEIAPKDSNKEKQNSIKNKNESTNSQKKSKEDDQIKNKKKSKTSNIQKQKNKKNDYDDEDDDDDESDMSSSTVSSSSLSLSALTAMNNEIKLVISKEYKKSDQFHGIFSELTKINKGNPIDKEIVQITGNRDEDYGTFSSLLNYSYNGVNYTSNPEINSHICFDFKSYKVAVSAYSIKSSNQKNANYLFSWVLEGSDNKNDWVVIDSHSNDRCLCSKSKSCSFVIEDKSIADQKFRYIQIRMTGKSPRNNFIFSITNIELFGKYFSFSSS